MSLAEEKTSLMDDLASAWEESEKEDEGNISAVEDTSPVESSDFDSKPAAESTEETPYVAEAPLAEGASKISDLDTPPAGLPPAAREVWADVPAAVKQAIAKREEDFSRGIQMYSAGAKRADEMDRVLQPYQQFFAINGNNPPAVIKDVLSTAATLQMGSPQQKAQAAANLVKQFGVDIGMLDSVLVGQQPQEDPNQHFQQLLDQRLGPMQQQLQGYQQREQQYRQQETDAIRGELQTFAAGPQNEFYADVRSEMADILDLAANRGVTVSLADAYHKACLLHPEISKIVRAREGAAGNQQRARAGSSIHGAPSGLTNANKAADMRGAIELAWENTGRL